MPWVELSPIYNCPLQLAEFPNSNTTPLFGASVLFACFIKRQPLLSLVAVPTSPVGLDHKPFVAFTVPPDVKPPARVSLPLQSSVRALERASLEAPLPTIST